MGPAGWVLAHPGWAQSGAGPSVPPASQLLASSSGGLIGVYGASLHFPFAWRVTRRWPSARAELSCGVRQISEARHPPQWDNRSGNVAKASGRLSQERHKAQSWSLNSYSLVCFWSCSQEDFE